MKESKSFIRKIISNPIVQTLAIYVSSGWILIELLEYFISHFNLNEQSRNILLVILLCGLPVSLVIAWLVSRERKSTDEHALTAEEDADEEPSSKSTRLFKRPALSIPVLAIGLILLVFGIRYFNHRAKIKWAKEQALPEIERLRVKGEFTPAFNLLRKAEKYISDDPEFQEYQFILIRKLTILTDPPGADIYLRKYDDMDYLETRQDIDTGKLGYLGHSWGGSMGGIIPSVEPRLKLSVLIVGGLDWREYYPEADPINYLPRVTIPVLMLNGKYDATFPFEATVKPFFEFLGTPESDKRLFISDTDHWIPKADIIRETLEWMDMYFGPVN